MAASRRRNWRARRCCWHDPPLEYTTLRFAAEDLELGGQQILRGDVVAMAPGSASLDASLDAAADPDLLDVEREARRHLALGHGIHYCLWAALVRPEATIAIGSLLRRFPGLRPAIPLEDVPWVLTGMVRGPQVLPVRLTPQTLPG